MADVTNEIMTNDKTKILLGEFLNFYTPRRQRIRSFKVYFSPKQEGTGTPSPENVRPISGWTGVEVQHCGKNLCPASNGVEIKDWEYQNQTRKYLLTGLPANTPMTLSVTVTTALGTAGGRRLYLYGKESAFINTGNSIGRKSITVNTTEDGQITITHNNTALNIEEYANAIQDIQLELGSEATEYTPYKTNLSIPKEYQEVEYIESDGHQYIMTDVMPAQNLSFHCKFLITSASDPGFGNVFGSRINSSVREYQLTAFNSGIVSVGTRNRVGNITVNTINEVNFDGNTTVTVNGTEVAITTSEEQHTQPLTLFGICQGASRNYQLQAGRIYELSFGDVANFIPCYRKSDKVAGMYDTITGQFYTNSGTGEFITGPAVNRYDVDWSEDVGTVYGGYVDLVSGELVEDIVTFSVDENTTPLEAILRPSAFMVSYNLPQVGANENLFAWSHGLIRDRSTASDTYPTKGKACCLPYNKETKKVTLGAPDGITTKEDWDTWITNNSPLQFVYRLATPITHQLSPTTLSTLMWDNNFWSNADRIEIEYDYIGIFDPIESRKNIFTATPHLDNLIGNNFTFSTDMPRDLKKCVINFEPKQSADVPTPNAPISVEGWDEIFVYPASANLLPLKWPSDSFLGNFGTNSTTISSASVLRCCSIYVGKNTQIRYQVESMASFAIAFSDTRLTSRTGAKIYEALNMTNRDSKTFNSGEHPWLVFKFSSSAYPTSSPESDKVMLSFGNTNKTYFPRTDWKRIDITFPEIIYGGYLNVLTGELWRTWRYIPLSNLTWSYNKSWRRFESGYLTSAARAVDGQQNVYCDIYRAFPNTTGDSFYELGDYAITFNSSNTNNPYLIINDSRYTTKDDFVADLTGNIAYKLKTPQFVTTLEPQVIHTLQGVNNIWSNANGNLEIAYWKHGDDAYQHIPTSNAITTTDNYLIATEDGYVIGEEDDFIAY